MPDSGVVRSLTAVVLLGVALSALTAACTGTGSAGTAPPSAAASSASATVPSAAPTPTPSQASTGNVTPTSPAGRLACATSQLRLSRGTAGGAAGTTYQQLRLVNQGGHPCAMFGFPGVSFLDAAGNQVGLAAARDQTTPAHRVVVAPGAAARFAVAIPNADIFDRATCQPAQTAAVRVYPPGQTSALRMSYQTTICTTRTGQVRVSPVS